MKKSKILFFILGALVFSLSACNASNENSGGSNDPTPGHEHTYSSSWNYDDTYHWHDATCGHDVVSNKERHTFNDVVTPASYSAGGYTTHTCTVCGYSYIDSQTPALPITITWKNYDGTILEVDENVPYGSIPSFDSKTPVKPANSTETFMFSGWSPSVETATHDEIYIAQFSIVSVPDIDEKTITMSRTENKPSNLDAFEVNSSVGTKFELESSNALAYTNRFLRIENGGYILNRDEINGISSINVVFTGTLTIEYGWYQAGNISYDVFDETLSSGVPYYFRNNDNPSFIKIISSSSSYITSIVINYKDVLAFNRYENDNIECVDSDTYLKYEIENDFAYVSASLKKNPSKKQDFRLRHWYNGRPVVGIKTVDFVSHSGTVYYSSGSSYKYSYTVHRAVFAQYAVNIYLPNTITELGDYIFYGAEGSVFCEYSNKDALPEGFSQYWNVYTMSYRHANMTTSYGYTLPKGPYDRKYMTVYYNAKLNQQTTADGLNYVVYNDSLVEINGYTGSNTSVVIPNKLSGCSNIIIGKEAFKKSKIRSITLSSSVNSIGEDAFNNCTSLTNVDLSMSSLVSLPRQAFFGCSSLTTVVLPDVNFVIGEYAFGNCRQLTSINLLSVTSLKQGAFSGSSALESVEFSKSLVEIQRDAFSDCSSLTNIDLSKTSVSSLEPYTFSNCKALSSITISNSLNSINNSVFYGCNEFSTKYYGTLESWLALEGKDNLKDVHLYLNGDETETTSIVIPNGTTEIPDYAFYNCSSISQITIPETVETIGASAFYNCVSLDNVFIPDSVTVINANAFLGCTSLSTFVLGRNAVINDSSTLGNCPCSEDVIYFHGSVEEFNSLTKAFNYQFINFYSEEEPTQEQLSLLPAGSLYWHYVNGVPTLW